MADEEPTTMETTDETPVAMETKEPTEINPEWGDDISPDNNNKLFKKILQEGTGTEKPKEGDEVYVHYTGRLLDGTIFDSSVERNELFKFKLGQGQVIKGWDVGVATMKKGEKCLLTCSPEFAYGESGSGEKIPPNSTLQFEVELFRWAGEDITKDGGVLMSVVTKGTGYKKPTEGSTVNVYIKGTIGDYVIEDREVEFVVGEGSEVNVIEGVEKGVEKMMEKEEVTLTIQPGYAFGVTGDTEKCVPPNTEVTYFVRLDSFVKAKSSYEYDEIEDRVTDATTIKDKGTVYFKAGKYKLALKVYKRGYGLVDKVSIYKDEEKEQTKNVRLLLLLNMAACHLKLDEAIEAREQCDKVLEEDSANVKAHFRKGQAYQKMQDYDEAMLCFQEVVKLESGNRSALQQIQVCRQKIRQQLEKDKRLYANMFKNLGKREPLEVEPMEDTAESGSPEKDTIAQTMEEEETKQEEPVQS